MDRRRSLGQRGTVTVANGGEEAKALGMWPADAAMPASPPRESDDGPRLQWNLRIRPTGGDAVVAGGGRA